MKSAKLVMLLTIALSTGCAMQAPKEIQRFNQHEWENDLGYANEVRVGDLLYISGICSEGDTMEEQVRGVFAALDKILKEHNLTFSDIIKENAYTTDIEALKAANSIRLGYYEKNVYPSATWVEVNRLFIESFKLEVEVIALIGGN